MPGRWQTSEWRTPDEHFYRERAVPERELIEHASHERATP
jgi:hypothetical protein